MSVNEPVRVLIPLINPNEPEALLAGVYVSEGQLVEPGDLICSLETTKSTAELEAEAGGYVVGLSGEAGDPVNAGDVLCYLADDPAWQPPQSIIKVDRTSAEHSSSQVADDEVPAGLRITQSALSLARQMSVDLSDLPLDRLITERQVRAYIDAESRKTGISAAAGPFDPTAIIIFGGGGHGKALIDLLRVLGTYRILYLPAAETGIRSTTIRRQIETTGGKRSRGTAKTIRSTDPPENAAPFRYPPDFPFYAGV